MNPPAPPAHGRGARSYSKTGKPDDSALANVFERLNALHESGTIIINPLAVKMQSDDAQGFLDWAGQQVKGGAQ